MDHALCLLMLRCGLRVSEVAKLKLSDIDWDQKSLLVEQGKGRRDRVVYLSTDVLAGLKTCLDLRPPSVPGDLFFWNRRLKQIYLQTIKKVINKTRV
jgi:integrase